MNAVKGNNKIIIESNKDKHTYAKLLQQFPKIKFSYELKSYKKVSNHNQDDQGRNDNNNNVFFIIPKGKKFLVWFKNDECLFLELDNDKQVVNISSKKPSRIFPNDTILYGTHFYYRAPANVKSAATIQYYFTIENIHYYSGINLDATQTVFEKCKTLHLAFSTVTLEKTFQIDVGLPHIETSLDRISAVKPFYQIYCIQKKKANDAKNQYENIRYEELSEMSRREQPPQPESKQPESKQPESKQPKSKQVPAKQVLDNPDNSDTTAGATRKYIEKSNKSSNNMSNSYNKKYKIFIVSADIQNDVYHLTDTDNNDDLIASIPDYKTSVFMNALFRNIKENRSLDALEESDDEDEFENTNIDKFVNLTKKIKMKCVYNFRFKKWTPIECVK
jgi:hypothetical protein